LVLSLVFYCGDGLFDDNRYEDVVQGGPRNNLKKIERRVE
jgi:hypothetical protein